MLFALNTFGSKSKKSISKPTLKPQCCGFKNSNNKKKIKSIPFMDSEEELKISDTIDLSKTKNLLKTKKDNIWEMKEGGSI